jgi:hypothetical protein
VLQQQVTAKRKNTQQFQGAKKDFLTVAKITRDAAISVKATG